MISRRTFIKRTACGAGLLGLRGMLTAIPGYHQAEEMVSCLIPTQHVPVISEVDIVIIGGTSAAVSAAVEARQNGASVFLLAPHPYLGEDICGTLRLWLDEQEEADTKLAQEIYTHTPPSPLHVKTVLENELLHSNIPFLYSTYLVDFLYDRKSRIAGGIVANRSGMQAIRAKVIIDATMNATGCRIGKWLCSERAVKKQRYEFTVVGNTEKQHDRMILSETKIEKINWENTCYTARKYVFEFPDATDNYASLCQIEHQIRDITWDADQVDASDFLCYVPTKMIRSIASSQQATTLANISSDVFRPEKAPNVYALNVCADLSYAAAWQLLRPSTFMRIGVRLGKEAALLAQTMAPAPLPEHYAEKKVQNNRWRGQIVSKSLRPVVQDKWVRIPSRKWPVLDTTEVLVCGGGTAGAPAAIGASRQGADTLLLEYLHGVGGLSTMGKVNRYWDGYRKGFTEEIDREVCAMAPESHPRRRPTCVEWLSDWKMEWYRKEIRKHKGKIWFGALGCGAIRHKNRVCGALIATPYGPGAVTSKIVIDSTSSADIAIAAGASYDYPGTETEALQGGGLAWKNPNDFHNSTDWTFVDDTDVLDVTRLFVAAKEKYKNQYDISQLPQSRERRRIRAEYIITVNDLFSDRTYPDTISHHCSSFDSHGYTIDPYLTLKPPMVREKLYQANVPFRSLIPQNLEDILVIGLAVGAERDVIPVIRMQACLQNQGYATGYTAASLVKNKQKVREANIPEIQRHLIAIGNLPEYVTVDNRKIYTEEEFFEAAGKLSDQMEGLEILLSDLERSLPVVRRYYTHIQGTPEAINSAKVLAMFGDPVPVPELIREVSGYSQWDKGWAFFSMGQFGPCMSPLDSLIIALGNTKQVKALPVLLPLARQLRPESAFSHFRAISLACEKIGDAQAIPVLADLLQMEGMRHHHLTSYQQARSIVNNNRADDTSRNKSLKELYLARALYRCGDKNGLGESILKKYAGDLRNNFARHANSLLD